MLIENNITHKKNPFSGSIGKRYSRSDEIGIPYSITVDYDSLKYPFSITLRERDSMEQVRVNVSACCFHERLLENILLIFEFQLNDLIATLNGLSNGKILWNQMLKIKN